MAIYDSDCSVLKHMRNASWGSLQGSDVVTKDLLLGKISSDYTRELPRRNFYDRYPSSARISLIQKLWKNKFRKIICKVQETSWNWKQKTKVFFAHSGNATKGQFYWLLCLDTLIHDNMSHHALPDKDKKTNKFLPNNFTLMKNVQHLFKNTHFEKKFNADLTKV